jgi:hypothetical protein
MRRVMVWALLGVAAVLGATAVPARAAEHVQLRGVLRVMHVDHKDGSSSYIRRLETAHGRYRLTHVRGLENLPANAPLAVRGTRAGRTLRVLSMSQLPARQAAAAPSGQTTVLVMMIYWNTHDGETKASVEQQIGTADGAWYHEVSYGKLTGLTATATDWMQVTKPADPCNFDGPLSKALAAAKAHGFVPADYDRLMVYLPPVDSCFWAGIAEVGGIHSEINGGYMDLATTTHELGHNYGLYHSNSLTCGSAGSYVPLSSKPSLCRHQEYGDPMDTMGNLNWAGVGHFNARQKDRLSWLTGRMQVVTGSGTYTIAPLEQQLTGVQALKLSDGVRTYWLEYRQPVGADSFLSAHAAATAGPVFHIEGSPLGWPGSELLDMRANNEFWSSALPVGSSWKTPNGRWRFTTLARDSAGTTVKVDHLVDTTGPTIGSFTRGLAPTQVGLKTTPVRVAWSASDPSGVCRYTLAERVNGGPWTRVTLARALSKVATRPLRNPSSYEERLTARDCKGNVTTQTLPSFQLLRVGEASSSISYSGSWARTASSTAIGGAMMTTAQAGASASLTATGTTFALVAPKGPTRGSVRVLVDGEVKATVNLYAKTATPRMPVFRTNFFDAAHPAAASHVIRLIDVSTHSRTRLSLDGFVILV